MADNEKYQAANKKLLGDSENYLGDNFGGRRR